MSESTHEISGDMTIESPDVGARWSAKIQPSSETVFDFSQVGHVDSSGIALLVQWKRFAQANSATINFINLPEQMLKLITLYELGDIVLSKPAT